MSGQAVGLSQQPQSSPPEWGSPSDEVVVELITVDGEDDEGPGEGEGGGGGGGGDPAEFFSDD